jgi:hypothetical protein
MSATMTVAEDAIGRAREAAMPDATEVAKYRRYVLGTQPNTLTEEMRADLEGVLANGLVYNLCALAVQSATNMLSLARIDIRADAGPVRDALAEAIDDLWVRNQVDELAASVHFATIRDGNYALVLSWDGERVRFREADWWNGQRGIWCHYSGDGQMDYAVEEWSEVDPDTQTSFGRRWVYYADRMERFERRDFGGGWVMYNEPTDPVQGGIPVPWTVPRYLNRAGEPGGVPIGIPVVHFPCFVTPNHQPGTGSTETNRRYGRSLLAGGPLGLQDAKNDILYDILAAARRTAFPIYTATGVSVPNNADGTPGSIVATPGMVLWNSSPQASYGILSPGDMGQLMATGAYIDRAFALQTATIMQIVADQEKDLPSGVAMWRQQLAAVRQAQRLATVFATRWGSLFHKATQILNAYTPAGLDTDTMLVAAYDPIEVSDAAAMIEMAKQAREAGLPWRYISRLLGMTDAQADEIMGWLEEERGSAAEALDRAIGEAA